MKLSKSMKKLLVDEIVYVTNAMEKEGDDEKKLYFFSGIQGIVNRIFNIEFNEDLVLLHHILKTTHEAINLRLNALKKGQDTVVPLLKIQFEKLIELVKELGEKIQQDESLIDVLKKFTIIAYSTTGNGYYLLNKGMIKFNI